MSAGADVNCVPDADTGDADAWQRRAGDAETILTEKVSVSFPLLSLFLFICIYSNINRYKCINKKKKLQFLSFPVFIGLVLTWGGASISAIAAPSLGGHR